LESGRHASIAEVNPRLLVVAGPTGSGKSALALELAEALGGEIVNFDSLQLYRGFDIGTAKTPVSQRRGIPHHLFDVLDITAGYDASGCSAGDYARMARPILSEISSRGRIPIAVGGSGFYLRALLHGLPELPPRDEALRARLEKREERRPGSLHRLLRRLDPASAGRIHPRDVHKTIRALEIRLLTGTRLPASETAKPLTGYSIVKLGLNPERERLFARLNDRVERMFGEGLVDEVRKLLARGATGTEKPFESLGYKQALQYIHGEIPLEHAILSTQIETRQYAKRQWTWFHREPAIHWMNGFGDDPALVREALDLASR